MLEEENFVLFKYLVIAKTSKIMVLRICVFRNGFRCHISSHDFLSVIQIFIQANAALIPINVLYICFKTATTCHTFFKGLYSVPVAFSVFKNIHNQFKCHSFTRDVLSREMVEVLVKDKAQIGLGQSGLQGHVTR